MALLLSALAGSGALAQDDTAQRGRSGTTIVPRVGVTQTLTDNVALSSTARDAALVTQVSPGIRIESRSGRVRGTFDYALNGILYVGSDAKNQVQNALSTSGVVELIENSVYVDGQASIGQQAISAFGQQSGNSSLSNPNRTEVATLNLSPYWRGRVSNIASFELRGGAQAANTKDSIVGDTHTESLSLRVNGLSAGRLQWWGSANTQTSHFRAGDASYKNSTLNLGLTYRPDVDYAVTVNGGPERYDYGRGAQSSSNYGVNFTWTPSPRTRAVAEWQRHQYGNAHTLSLEHRMARSVWRYSDVQSVNLSTPSGTNPVAVSLYSLYLQQCIASQADPSICPASVTDFLIARGLDPNAQIISGYVAASSPTIQRLQDLSFSLDGLRDSVVVSLSQSTSGLLPGAQATGGDLALTSEVKQRGLTVSVSHRLTPDSSVTGALSVMQNRGTQPSLGNTLRNFTANWSSRLGRQLSVSLGARHTGFTGSTGYTENALIANLTQQF